MSPVNYHAWCWILSDNVAVVTLLMQHDLFCRYDTVGIHLLKRANTAADYNKLQYEGYDGGDPRIVSWMEDIQSATNSLENRVVSLECFHKKEAQSTEIKQ
jgi:hypothetical protein